MMLQDPVKLTVTTTGGLIFESIIERSFYNELKTDVEDGINGWITVIGVVNDIDANRLEHRVKSSEIICLSVLDINGVKR